MNEEVTPLTVYAFVDGYGRVVIPALDGEDEWNVRDRIIEAAADAWITAEPDVGGPAFDVRASAITAVWLKQR